MIKKLPKHIVRLLLLLSFFLLVALVAKSYLTDPSFYKFGHYRADAIPELAAGEPVYKGSAFCLDCHQQRADDWSKGVHVAVQCEVCHGPDRGCPENGKIVFAEHPFPDEEKPQCKTCHNPHAPTVEELLEDAPAGDAAVTEVKPPESASKCLKCHGNQGQGRRNNPPLAGIEPAVFIELMNQYKSGAGNNKTMIRYAKALSDEEIAELAHYYAGLPATLPEPPPE
jgi:cytochrome c553